MSQNKKDIVYVYEWSDEEDNYQNISIIRMFGINKDRKTVMIKIENFSPFCYLELPDIGQHWNETNLNVLNNAITSQYKVCKPNLVSFEMKKRLYNSKFEFNSDTDKYEDKTFPYLKMYFSNVSKMNQFIAYTRKGINTSVFGRITTKIYGAEKSLVPSLQLMGTKKIRPVGWVYISKAIEVDEIDKETIKDKEYIVDFERITPLASDKTSKLPVYYPSILSFDIETFSSRIVCMPDATIPTDCVFQIGCTLRTREGKVEKYLFTLKECNDIEDITVIRCKSERLMLIEYAKFVHDKDPDVVTGYNIYGFDFTYLIKRAEHNNCYEKFMKQSCITGRVCKKGGIEWESSAYGKQTINYIQAEGRLVFDMLPYIRKSFRLTNYKLETVCEEFLKTNKDPLKYTDIFNCYIKGDGKSLSLCGKYCVQDSYVVYLLFQNLYTWYDITESANTNEVPMFYLYAKGQQIKMFSQVFSYCYHNNIVINVQNTINTGKYTGATVLSPIPGIYTNVLPFDFASLYPSIIMAYNIDYTRCLTDEDTDIPDSACHVFDWTEHVGCEHDPNRKIHKKESAILKAEENKICSHFKYRYLKSDSSSKGVIPTILHILIKARKDVRKDLEKCQQEYKILQKLYEDKDLSEDDKKEIKLEDYDNKDKIKKRLDELDTMKIVLDKRQLSYKVNANSMYGAMGVSRGFLPLKHGAMTVTYIGRTSIQKAVNFIKENWEGATVVYGDTDSCFVKFPQLDNKSHKEIWSFAENVVSKVKTIFPDPMKLEFEGKINASYFILTKKRYVSQACDVNGVLDKKISKKGVVLQRRDNCKLLKDMYEDSIKTLIANTAEVQNMKSKEIKEIMRHPVTMNLIDNLVNYLNMCFQLQYGYKDFVITKGLNKTEYKGKRIPPHASLAKKLEKRGIPVPVNTRLEFLYVKLDKKDKLQEDIIEELNYFKDNRDVLRIDFIYYLEHQIVKPVDEMMKVAFGLEDFMKKHCALRKIKEQVNSEIKSLFSPELKIIF
jgi:DNA polymerase elongation subunit (family B)